MNRLRWIPYKKLGTMTQYEFVDQNIRFSWYRTGSEDGKPLLILHGWGSNSGVMQPLAEKLSDIRTAYLIDLPGFGNSPEPDSAWGVDDYADAVKRFVLKHFQNSTQKIDLLVHSFGGRVAIKLLTDTEFSGRFDRIIFTGAAGLKPDRKPGYFIRKYTAKTLKLPFLILPEPLKSSSLNKLRKSRLWKKLGSADYQQVSGVMRETFVKTVTEYLDSLLPGIDHEILLIWGEDDTATPIRQGERMDQLLKQSALIRLKNAGHYSFLDQPSQFVSIVKAYLEP